MDKKKAGSGAPKRRGRWRRRALIGAGVLAVSVPGMWIAIHQIPGFGPFVVDGVRAVVGPRPIAWAEDVAYGLQDRFDRWRYKDAAPKTFWEEPPPTGSAAVLPAASGETPVVAAPATPSFEGFPPAAVAAPVQGVASTGDGTWVAMKDPAMVKTVVHPDPKRGFAAVAVVAIDLRRIDLHLVAGTAEPTSAIVPANQRPGLVPKDAIVDLVAAFNGGFKTIHGHYGMMIEGETFVPPRDGSCTVALFRDGALKIRTWSEVRADEPHLAAYRQTPPCLVEEGKTNTALDVEYNRNWGSTVSGETVIRRSAIGVDATGHTLFYGLGEAVTAQALARAMKAIGAENAAQLDVNYSYPRFLLYERAAGDAGPHVGSALIPGIKYMNHEYVTEPAVRDFFYLAHRRTTS